MVPLFSGSQAGALGGAIFSGLLVASAVTDIRTRRIPNRLVVVLAVAGCVFSLAAGGLHALESSAGGLVVGLAVWLPLYLMGWLGAGDVKLFAAAAAWLGPERALAGAAAAALLGGLLAIVWAARAYGVAGSVIHLSAVFRDPGSMRRGKLDASSRSAVPYGVSLAAGAAMAAWLPNLFAGAAHVAR